MSPDPNKGDYERGKLIADRMTAMSKRYPKITAKRAFANIFIRNYKDIALALRNRWRKR